ncbi:RING finger protein 223 [Ambystoma mexicanum]|uniref:RING finger protein 223 n=1 Tax=Ambystoma mexicanum TaxID=8296 RepID=UPI0037E9BE02
MDSIRSVWHTQVVDLPELQIEDVERAESLVECAICFSAYDNVFKTPKSLQCSHTVCLECVARLVASLPVEKSGNQVPCPFCRQPTPIPEQGAPALQTSQETLSILPAHLQHEEPVWIEGTKLCYKQPSESDSSSPDTCICVDIGLTKAAAAAAPSTERRGGMRGYCCRCTDWKRILLITLMLLVLFCILLWPVQCVLKTGNLRCSSAASPTPYPPHSMQVSDSIGH